MRNCGKEGWRRGDIRVDVGLGMGKEGWRGDSRVYGGLGLGTGAKAPPDQYFSKKVFVKIL